MAGNFVDPSKLALEMLGRRLVTSGSCGLKDPCMGSVVSRITKFVFGISGSGQNTLVNLASFVFDASNPFSNLNANSYSSIVLAFSGNTHLLTRAGYLDGSHAGLVLKRDGMSTCSIHAARSTDWLKRL